jgi:amino acid transporter
MIFLSFQELLIMDVIIYGAALFLEFIALIILRKRVPNEERPFRIPLNTWGLYLMIACPLGVYVVALIGAILSDDNALSAAIIALGALLFGEVLWRLFVAKRVAVAKS